MERPDASGGGARRWLCLERPDLSQLVEGRLGDHRHASPRQGQDSDWLASRQPAGLKASSGAGDAGPIRRSDDCCHYASDPLAAAFGARFFRRCSAQETRPRSSLGEGRRWAGLSHRPCWRPPTRRCWASSLQAPVTLASCRGSRSVRHCRAGKQSPSRSPSCAISTSVICGTAGTLCLADDHLLSCLAIFCFGFSPTNFRRIISAIWMASASACSTTRGLPRKRDGVPRTLAGARPRLGPAPCWAVNGTAGCIGWRCSPMALPGTAKSIPACRRSPWRSPAPAGTARSSSACAISRRKGPPHEDRTSETSSLRDLYPRLD